MSRRQPFEPIPDDIEKQESRTQRAYREPMQVALSCAGGRYTVYAASGNTYQVDIATKTCTCGDYQQNEPDEGCKHVRRVDVEVRANRVPTPDGRLPASLMMDGGIVATHRATDPDTTGRAAGRDTDDRIRGPIAEFDADGHLTGATYYRCQRCEDEAMRRRDLENCCSDDRK